MSMLCPENFDREMGCTEAQWLGWLQSTLASHPHHLIAQTAQVRIGPGQLTLSWRSTDPQTTATAHTPRMVVSFRFHGVDDVQRYLFVKRFDVLKQSYFS